MGRMPGADWRPIPASSSQMSRHDVVCLHTMVMSLPDCDGYFRRIAPGVNAHFGTGHDGTIYQWVDTDTRSGANYNGNYRVISIENADRGTGFPAWNPNDASQVPAFTADQIEACARICAWAHDVYDIPLELIPDALPSRRGIGYHRQGVPGYMVPGAEQWSTARGKACPGDRRIAQIPLIIARARQIAAGIDPTPPEEDDVALSFITDGDSKPWWAYDGFKRRYVRPGEPQQLVDLGLVKAVAVKKIPPADLSRIPRSDVDLIDEAEIAKLVAAAIKADTPTG